MIQEPKIEDMAWHLDRRVPIAVILTLLIQTGAAIWWASGVDSRIAYLEQQEASRPANRDAIQQQLVELKIQLTALRENVQATNDSLKDLRRNLENISNRLLDQKKNEQ